MGHTLSSTVILDSQPPKQPLRCHKSLIHTATDGVTSLLSTQPQTAVTITAANSKSQQAVSPPVKRASHTHQPPPLSLPASAVHTRTRVHSPGVDRSGPGFVGRAGRAGRACPRRCAPDSARARAAAAAGRATWSGHVERPGGGLGGGSRGAATAAAAAHSLERRPSGTSARAAPPQVGAGPAPEGAPGQAGWGQGRRHGPPGMRRIAGRDGGRPPGLWVGC